MRIATNDSAFRRKQPVSPAPAIANPASIGPITRERLNCIELSAIAFVRSSRPTRFRKSDWCEGVVNALATPLTMATAATRGTEAKCHPVAAARVSAQAICTDWVASRIRRRS